MFLKRSILLFAVAQFATLVPDGAATGVSEDALRLQVLGSLEAEAKLAPPASDDKAILWTALFHSPSRQKVFALRSA